MRTEWYSRVLKAIDRYGLRLSPEQIEFVSGLIDSHKHCQQFSKEDRVSLRVILRTTVPEKHRPRVGTTVDESE